MDENPHSFPVLLQREDIPARQEAGDRKKLRKLKKLGKKRCFYLWKGCNKKLLSLSRKGEIKNRLLRLQADFDNFASVGA